MNCYNVISESYALTEGGVDTLAGGIMASHSVFCFWAAKKYGDLYKEMINANTQEEAVELLNKHLSALTLQKEKLNDPKEYTLWKRLWTINAGMYKLLSTVDDPDWKKRIIKMIKSNKRWCIIAGGLNASFGGLLLGNELRNHLMKDSIRKAAFDTIKRV